MDWLCFNKICMIRGELIKRLKYNTYEFRIGADAFHEFKNSPIHSINIHCRFLVISVLSTLKL